MSFDFEEEKYVSHSLESEKVLEMANFIVYHRFPRVMPLIDETLQKIFQDSKPTLILFLISGGRVLTNFKNITKEYPEMNILFTNLGTNSSSRASEYLMDIIGIKKQEAPVLVYLPMTNPEQGIMPKYKTSKLTKKNMKSFIDSAQAGKLEIYKKSQDDNDNLTVRKYSRVTLNNFDEKVMKSGKYYLLGLEMFHEHTPDEIKKEFKDISISINHLEMNDVLEAGICDIYRNEILEKVSITGLPHIVLYDKEDKSKQSIYKGELKARNIRKWIEEVTGLEIGAYEKHKFTNKNPLEEAAALMAENDTDL